MRHKTSDRVLAILRRDELTVGELADRTGLTTSQIRSAVARLYAMREIVSDGGRPSRYRAKG